MSDEKPFLPIFSCQDRWGYHHFPCNSCLTTGGRLPCNLPILPEKMWPKSERLTGDT